VLVNAASNWTIANNVFIKDDVAGATSDRNALYINSPSTYISNGTFANNIIAGNGYIHAVKLPDTKNIWTLFDYNIIIPVGTEVVRRGRTPLTLSQLQVLGYMKHGSTADPMFVNASSDWHLQSGSPAINTGTNMNYTIDFEGKAIDSTPDIGISEFAGIIPPDQANTDPPGIPSYVSSEVQNAATSVLEMTYDMTLANIVPASSAFTVMVNSAVRTVDSVGISGTKVLLSLASPVASKNQVTVAYTKPSVNPLQGTKGGQAVSIGPQKTMNNVNSSKKEIKIYPNPATRFINISNIEASSKSLILRIFDFSGRLCMETRLNTTVNLATIPIFLKPGMYILYIVSDSIIQCVQKLLVIYY
jgi:uncharacterized repeat protein (TIGR02059 family)